MRLGMWNVGILIGKSRELQKFEKEEYEYLDQKILEDKDIIENNLKGISKSKKDAGDRALCNLRTRVVDLK